MKLSRIILALVFFFIALPASAAGEITREGAAHLKAVFESILRDQAKIIGARGQETLEQQGDIIVEKAGKFYAVTLPHLQVQNTDGTRLELGIISINASPHDPENTKGQWKMTIALPTPITFFDEKGREIMRISMDGQQAAGIFHENSQQFSKLDAKYTGITIEGITPTYKATIPEIIARFDMDTGDDGRWSGPAYIEAKNINITKDNNAKTVNLAKLKAAFDIDRFDPVSALTYRKRLITLADKGMLKTDRISQQTSQELGSALYDAMTKGMNGFDSSYNIEDLTITNTASLDGEKDIFKMDTATLALGTGGFLDENAYMTMNYGYSGMSASTIPPDRKDILPADANIDLKIKNIPFTRLVQVVQNVLGNGEKNAESLKIASFGLLLKVPALLSNAGTVIELNNNYIGSDLYRADINGEIKADIAAANSATANIRGTFRGLNALLQKLKSLKETVTAKKPTVKPEKISRIITTLEWLKTIATEDKATNGKAVHVFDFIMNDKGQILLNGKDVKTLPKPQTTKPAPEIKQAPTQPI